MPTSVKDDLAKLSRKGRGAGARIYATVIGSKLRDFATGRLVAMQTSCPAFVVYCTGVGFWAPAAEESEDGKVPAVSAAILEYWQSHEDAPTTYEWTEGESPPLPSRKKSSSRSRDSSKKPSSKKSRTANPTPQETDDDRTPLW
jgi:hypothetical protein